MRLSQINRGSDPVDSLAGVTFRHLAMLAQIKTSDNDVWNSLRNSGHLSDEPNSALQNRLERMRLDWKHTLPRRCENQYSREN